MTTILRAPPLAVVLGGEIDAATTPAIRSSLLEAIGAGNIHLAVSCSAVTFIDASGIGALAAAARVARLAGGGLSLQDPSWQVLRLLRIAHLDTSLRGVELAWAGEPGRARRAGRSGHRARPGACGRVRRG